MEYSLLFRVGRNILERCRVGSIGPAWIYFPSRAARNALIPVEKQGQVELANILKEPWPEVCGLALKIFEISSKIAILFGEAFGLWPLESSRATGSR